MFKLAKPVRGARVSSCVDQKQDEYFMELAVEQAKIGDSLAGAGEVGCVIVRGGDMIASGFNEARLRFDPTAHAEIVTLRMLGQKERTIKFSGCTIYVTLQPCTMCTAACVWAGIERIVYGASRQDVHSMYFDSRHLDPIDLVHDAYRRSIAIQGGVLTEVCSALYYAPSDRPPSEEQVNV